MALGWGGGLRVLLSLRLASKEKVWDIAHGLVAWCRGQWPWPILSRLRSSFRAHLSSPTSQLTRTHTRGVGGGANPKHHRSMENPKPKEKRDALFNGTRWFFVVCGFGRKCSADCLGSPRAHSVNPKTGWFRKGLRRI